MKDLAIVRSVTSPLGEHNFGTHYMLTGYRPTPVVEYPTYGAVVCHLQTQKPVLPHFIAVPDFRVGGGRLTGQGFLPASAAPSPSAAIPQGRFSSSRSGVRSGTFCSRESAAGNSSSRNWSGGTNGSMKRKRRPIRPSLSKPFGSSIPPERSGRSI